MSHFTVMVFGENPEEQLAPFQENNMGDCPKEYLEFHDTETEGLKEYQTGSHEKVIMPDGRKLNKWDDEFEVPGAFGIGHQKVRDLVKASWKAYPRDAGARIGVFLSQYTSQRPAPSAVSIVTLLRLLNKNQK